MSSIFSNLQDKLNLLGGGQAMPQGFSSLQPPVQGAPESPSIGAQMSQNYQKISEQPGFTNALFKLGSSLMAAREQGMGLGEGLLAGQEAYNSEIDRGTKQQALKAAAQLEQNKFNTGTALDLMKLEQADRRMQLERSMGLSDPAAVREYQYYASLSPEEQKRYLAVKRTSPEEVFGKTQAGIYGKDIATAQTSLPKIESDVKYAEKLLTDLVKHPGMSDVVGVPSISGGLLGAVVPGTEAAGFKTRLKQIEGQQFLSAYESLKGAGQITEIEGQKATEAMARLNTSQKEEEFKAAAEELKGILKVGLERAKSKAGGSYTSAQQTPIPTSGGIKFLGFE